MDNLKKILLKPTGSRVDRAIEKNEVSATEKNEVLAMEKEKKIQKVIDFIRDKINESTDEAEAIRTIIEDIDGATFRGCRSNGQSGALTFLVEIEGFGHGRTIPIKKRFH